jgi:hypothetical protein
MEALASYIIIWVEPRASSIIIRDSASNFFKKTFFMQQPYPLPCHDAKVTQGIQQVRATWSWSFAYQGPYACILCT